MTGVVGVARRRGEVWHQVRECTEGSSMETLTVAEAKEKGYTPCLECCPEGWPTDGA